MGWWEDALSDPEVSKAYEEAVARDARSVDVVCKWGSCVHFYDPVEKRIHSGWGSALCGCDNLPGWRSRHPEGMPKPAVPVKARGRHGSRVQRSRHRRRDWLAMLNQFES